MNNPTSAFSHITRTSARINSLIFVVIPLLLVLLTTLLWSASRIIEQEKRRLEVDFSSFIGYLREQENFLLQLKKQNQNLSQLIESRSYALKPQIAPIDWPLKLLEGKESLVSMPFTLACDKMMECSKVPSVLFSLGSYLADSYSTFWGSSYYPAAAVFFINEHDNITISVPSVGTLTGNESISPLLFKAITETVRKRLPELKESFNNNSKSEDRVIWIYDTNLEDNLVGIMPAGFDSNLWKGAQLFPQDIYITTLLSKKRISVLERILNPTIKHDFWLVHHEYGQLLGNSSAPVAHGDGLHFTKKALLLKLHNKTGEWVGYYKINYASFFNDNLWFPFSILAAFIFSVFCGWQYVRWYNQHIFNPAIEAQNDLLESEAFNRILIDMTPIGLCVISLDTMKIIFANPLAHQWLKLSNDNLESAEYQYLIKQVLKHSKKGEIHSFTSGMHILYISYILTNYRQQPVVLCSFTDMSRQAEIEEQLNKAKLAAEEANNAKSAFLSTMSHEIRTPLYGLIGTLELFSSTSLSELQSRYLEQTKTASQLLMYIISDILDISKIEASQLQLNIHPFNLFDVVHSSTQIYIELAKQKNIILYTCIDTELLPYRYGDSLRLQQVLCNLLSNAIKFTKEGSIVVHLNKDGDNNVLISVRDTGIGITEEQQKLLFEPFYQVHTVNDTYSGTGLGLFICQKLVTLMNGKLIVKSKFAMGSQFLISLPLPLSSFEMIEHVDLSEISIWLKTPYHELTKNLCNWLKLWGANVFLDIRERPFNDNKVIAVGIGIDNFDLPTNWKGKIFLTSLSNFDLSTLSDSISSCFSNDNQNSLEKINIYLPKFNCTVLIAEDNPINQAVLQEQLQLIGCTTFIADDGEEALAIWDSYGNDIDIILTDVNMPFLNGYGLTKKLREEGVTCPIIGVTANGLKEEEDNCLISGMDDWLVKPIKLNTLIQLLSHYFLASKNIDIKRDKANFNPLYGENKDITIEHFKHDILDLENAYSSRDPVLLCQISHRLRGALRVVEQDIFSQRLGELELFVKKNGITEAIQSEVQDIIQLLISWLNEESS